MPRKVTKTIALALCLLLFFQQSGLAQIAAQLDIAGHLGALRNAFIQDTFRPLHLRYLQYLPETNNFRLLLDKGTLNPSTEELENTSKDLLKYFFIGLALPNDTFWVNLRPDSPDNIIDDQLARTDIGRILLEADVQLKKDTALATSPQTPEGREYWDKLYKKAGEFFGEENVTIPTLTRPWIVPDEVIIRETAGETGDTAQGQSAPSAYIYKATLKVMLEEDYLKSTENRAQRAEYSFKDPRLKELNKYSSQLIRELIIPKLIKEVNTSKRYANLRQVYYSLILASWFKARNQGKDNPYARLIDQIDLTNLTSQEPWSKDTYFNAYKDSFAKGEYNLQEPTLTPYGQTIRSYFSGGIFGIAPKISPVIGAPTIVDPIGTRITADPAASGSIPDSQHLAAIIRNGDGKMNAQKEGNGAPVAPPSSALDTPIAEAGAVISTQAVSDVPRTPSAEDLYSHMFAVHATGTFPLEGIAKTSASFEQDGDKPRFFRPTLHFALGAIVPSHTGGKFDWSDRSYFVISRLKNLKGKLLNIYAHDTFILGDYQLSDGDYLVVPEKTPATLLTTLPKGIQVITYSETTGPNETVKKIITQAGGWNVSMLLNTGNIGSAAYIGKQEINNPVFFSSMLTDNPNLSFGLQCYSEVGAAFRFGIIDQATHELDICYKAWKKHDGNRLSARFCVAIIEYHLARLKAAVTTRSYLPEAVSLFEKNVGEVEKLVTEVKSVLGEGPVHGIRGIFISVFSKGKETIIPQALPSNYIEYLISMSPQEIERFMRSNKRIDQRIGQAQANFDVEYSIKRWLLVGTDRASEEGLKIMLEKGLPKIQKRDLSRYDTLAQWPFKLLIEEDYGVSRLSEGTSNRAGIILEILSNPILQDFLTRMFGFDFSLGNPRASQDLMWSDPETRGLARLKPFESELNQKQKEGFQIILKIAPEYASHLDMRQEEAGYGYVEAKRLAGEIKSGRERVLKTLPQINDPMNIINSSHSPHFYRLFVNVKDSIAKSWENAGLASEFRKMFPSEEQFLNSDLSLVDIYNKLVEMKEGPGQATRVTPNDPSPKPPLVHSSNSKEGQNGEPILTTVVNTIQVNTQQESREERRQLAIEALEGIVTETQLAQLKALEGTDPDAKLAKLVDLMLDAIVQAHLYGGRNPDGSLRGYYTSGEIAQKARILEQMMRELGVTGQLAMDMRRALIEKWVTGNKAEAKEREKDIAIQAFDDYSRSSKKQEERTARSSRMRYMKASGEHLTDIDEAYAIEVESEINPFVAYHVGWNGLLILKDLKTNERIITEGITSCIVFAFHAQTAQGPISGIGHYVAEAPQVGNLQSLFQDFITRLPEDARDLKIVIYSNNNGSESKKIAEIERFKAAIKDRFPSVTIIPKEYQGIPYRTQIMVSVDGWAIDRHSPSLTPSERDTIVGNWGDNPNESYPSRLGLTASVTGTTVGIDSSTNPLTEFEASSLPSAEARPGESVGGKREVEASDIPAKIEWTGDAELEFGDSARMPTAAAQRHFRIGEAVGYALVDADGRMGWAFVKRGSCRAIVRSGAIDIKDLEDENFIFKWVGTDTGFEYHVGGNQPRTYARAMRFFDQVIKGDLAIQLGINVMSGNTPNEKIAQFMERWGADVRAYRPTEQEVEAYARVSREDPSKADPRYVNAEQWFTISVRLDNTNRPGRTDGPAAGNNARTGEADKLIEYIRTGRPIKAKLDSDKAEHLAEKFDKALSDHGVGIWIPGLLAISLERDADFNKVYAYSDKGISMISFVCFGEPHLMFCDDSGNILGYACTKTEADGKHLDSFVFQIFPEYRKKGAGGIALQLLCNVFYDKEEGTRFQFGPIIEPSRARLALESGLPKYLTERGFVPEGDINDLTKCSFVLNVDASTPPVARDSGATGGPTRPSESLAANPHEGESGGIDFRALPIVTQAIGHLRLNMDTQALGRLSSVDVSSELQDIQHMVDSGIIPSGERIKEYVQASCAQGTLDIDKVISCISDILRFEEERCCQTEALLKDILVVLDSSRSNQELKEIFTGSTENIETTVKNEDYRIQNI